MSEDTFDCFEAFLGLDHEFLITAHVDPDGDAVGSCLGLLLALRHRGKEGQVILDSPLPDSLAFLPESGGIRRPEQVAKRFRHAFVLDSPSLERVGRVATTNLEANAGIAFIDHHWGNEGSSATRMVSIEAAATAELVYDLIVAWRVPLSPEIATCLYTGILSDTGSFRYANTSARTLRASARLVEHGAPAAAVAEALYATKTAPSLRILGLALASLETKGGGRIGAMTISREMFERAGAKPEDADGIVQYAKALVGARVGVLVQEVAPDEIRASLRSDGTVDVNQVASQFGGGGHRNAAGLRVQGKLETVRQDLFRALERAMNGGLPPPA
ncbi:MAG TPA: bifunctional oligoribonuclease/PAP phosphatase NrnA [Candidatus Binatia bacterium]|nr:bifunctional oligoribonuclease/PAP phosphatase NrnA [Candidatus Binatia bacterium]